MRYVYYFVLSVVLAIGILLIRAHIASGQAPSNPPSPLPVEQQQIVRALMEHGGVLLYRDDRKAGNPIVLVDFTNHPEFRDEWLKPLAGLAELQTVGLAGTALTDAGLEHLARFPKLQTLTLNDTPVTDDGLAKLSACTELQILDVRGTKVSTIGLSTLQKALPKLQITSDVGSEALANAADHAGAKTPPAGAESKQKPGILGNADVKQNGDVVRFDAAKVAALRERVMEIATVPENTPDGWSKSQVDPRKLLAEFTALRLREGFTLRAYQFKEEGNGNGFVWAMPIDADFPAPEDCPRLESHFMKAPKPFDALDDVMEAIEGDDTAEAYWQASLLRRELKDFGALWHGIIWGTHNVVDDDPFRGVGTENSDPMRVPQSRPGDWKWLEPRPTDWTPRVMLEPNQVVVTFYTFSGFDKEAIYRHVDIYRRGKYRARTEETKIAEGASGYRF